jgi:hypothetical protein
VANFWLHCDNTHSVNNLVAFLEETLQKLKGKTIGLIRLDNGFYSNEFLSYIEEKLIDYVVAVKFYIPI